MKARNIVVISLILLIGLAVFVVAQTEDEKYSNKEMRIIGSNEEFSYLNYNVNLSIKKGWNLIPGIAILDIKSTSDIKK